MCSPNLSQGSIENHPTYFSTQHFPPTPLDSAFLSSALAHKFYCFTSPNSSLYPLSLMGPKCLSSTLNSTVEKLPLGRELEHSSSCMFSFQKRLRSSTVYCPHLKIVTLSIWSDFIPKRSSLITSPLPWLQPVTDLNSQLIMIGFPCIHNSIIFSLF